MKKKNKKGRKKSPPFNISIADISWDIRVLREKILEMDSKIVYFKTEKIAYKQAIKDLKKLLK